MAEILAYGTAMLLNVFLHRNNPNKMPHGPNEFLYGVLYYIFGFASPYLFASDHLTFGLETHFLCIFSSDLSDWMHFGG